MAYSNKTGYPSVSDIIRPYIDTQYFTEDCMIRGTAVHACVANYLSGLYFPKLKSEYQGYVDSFKIWADENVEEVVKIETRLIDEDLGYCGKLDAVLRLKNRDKLCVVDWKTGKAMQRSHKLQIAAYAALEAKWEGLAIDAYDCIVVRLKVDGTGCRAVKYLDSQSDFEVFCGMLKAHRFFKDKVQRMHKMEKL